MSFIQIASWNIEHLDGSSRKDRPQSAFALADHIEMAGIDVAVLQEIYVTAHGEQITINDGVNAVPIAALPVHGKTRRNATLDIVCFLLEEHLDDVWRYIILPNRHAGDESQLIAVVFNQTRLSLKAVTALDVAHSDDGDSLWDRKPHVVELTSSIPVWYRDASGAWQQTPQTRSLSVVPLHMKSNYGGVTKNRRVRAKEAATLCEALEKVQDQIDPSLILLGDTNILANTEPAIETFIDAGFIDLNNHDAATYWSKAYGESPFDRIFVANGRKEFRYTRQYVLRSSDLELHDRLLSDHYMIKASIKDYVDDTDPR